MPHPSPFDLIQKASRRTTAADRWAALKVNTQQRVPLSKSPADAAAEHARQEARPPQPQQPPPQQPPFPPPQPRHPHVDEVMQRHEQAWKNATPLQAWTPKQAQERERKWAQDEEGERKGKGAADGEGERKGKGAADGEGERKGKGAADGEGERKGALPP